MPQLNEIRGRINQIDRELQRLLCERMDCASLVAEAKAAQAKMSEREPVIFDAAREEEILNAVNAGEHTEAVRRLYGEIIGVSRRCQYRILTESGMLSDPFAAYQQEAAVLLPVRRERLTDALRIICRYPARILRADADGVLVTAENPAELRALRVQLCKEGYLQ